MNKPLDLKEIRALLAQIKIQKRDTKEGQAQREAFRIRWGKRPEDL